jgi:hydrogenase expression/formation protein
MDIEGFARRSLARMEENKVKKILAERIAEIKQWDIERAEKWADAVVVEVKNATSKSNFILDYYRSGVSMGEFGVGSRGRGDFYVHRKIAEVIGESKAVLSTKDLDDAGVVRAGSVYISVAIDGIHSRLSEFPFVAGFHVTRAAMRDVYVMGSKPVAVFSDIHIADDGDVSKIFDHIAGISAVCELTGVPLVSGSTLRIGGDMVIGERMTGGVGCVGISEHITPRRNAREGDVILLTEGAGGGTIVTTAIYYAMHELIEHTLNIDFLLSCEAIFSNNLVKEIHSMSDVTNGGIRGDAEEISSVSGKALVFDYEQTRKAVNPEILKMLDELEIDFMGVSIDSLMIIAPAEVADRVKKAIKEVNVPVYKVGWVEKGKGAYFVQDGEKMPLKPRFRESAYTPLKKIVGELTPPDFEEMQKKVDRAVEEAIKKKNKVIDSIKSKSNVGKVMSGR